MKEIKPLGLDHLSDWFGNARTGAGLIQLGLTIQTVITNTAYNLLSVFKKDNQIRYGMMANSITNAANGLVQIRCNSLWPNRGDIACAVIGFRWKPGNKPCIGYFGIKLDQATGDGNAAPDLAILNVPSGSAEAYYEIKIVPYDHPNRGIYIYRDGDLIAQPAMGAWLTMAVFQTRACFTIGTSAVNVYGAAASYVQGDHGFSMEDVYVGWSNVPGEEVLQGPIRVKRVPYSEVTPAGWTAQGGKTPVEILNLNNNSAAVRTDYLASDVANTVLKAKLDLSGLKSTDRVVAVALSTSAWRDGGTTGNLSVKWKHTDGEAPSTSYSPTAGAYSTQFDVPNALLTTTPGGAALTKASMAALELVVTPSP